MRVSAADAESAEPAIASDADGSLYVVYVEHTGGKGDVFLQKYDSTLSPLGERLRVNPTAGSATSWRGDPPTVAVGPAGKVYVGWTRKVETEKGKGNDLVLSASHDGAVSFAGPVKVNDDAKPASHGMHSLAVDQTGQVYVAWLDERNVKTDEHAENPGDTQFQSFGKPDFEVIKAHHDPKATPPPQADSEEAEPNSEVFFAASNDGGKTFSPNKKIASDVCPCCKTSMLAAADGALYVSWRQVLPGDFRHIAVASTKDKGATFSERTIVSDDQWRLYACPVSGSALADRGDGRLNVTWYTAGEAGQAGVYSAESSDSGKTFGPRRLLGFDAAAGTPVAPTNSQACMFVTSGNDLTVVGDRAGTIKNATLPAAATVRDKIVTAFVRPEGDKRSVWVTTVPLG
ncbi:MAG: hypothetical protein HOP17_11760 [Acidobacteria bacterium]|nr:hypothetical protein [Acidobacteriota bacterium]